MNASDVKRGDRVVFETGGKEFNGIALSDAKVAVHPGVKKAGIYLDIAYLDGSGSLVKVLSAKVSKDAVSDGDLGNIVELEHAARSRDHRRSSLEAFGGDVTADDLRKDFRESKQDSGWKPFVEADPDLTVAGLKKELADATAERDTLREERGGLESAVLGLQTQLESVTAERNGLKASIDDLTLERDTLKEQLGNMTAESSESASSGSPSPSAADLDAVAAEQEAAKATAGDGESGAAASK